MTKKQSRRGGVDLKADRIEIGGDVVGRDKIVRNIQHIYQRALTAAEEARQARLIEAEYLAQGVGAFAQRLRDRVSDTSDADKGGPYKGLLEYRLSDAEIFFGRARAIRELLEHLQRGPLTVLHAESGAGKTSLIQAGISPRLITAGHLPVYLRPYNVAPPLAFKRAFLSNLTAAPSLAQASLRDFLSGVSGVLGSSATLYIFLDQFEEFFTQLEEQTRSEFVRELAECLDDESLNVRWALALRSEFFGNLATFRPRIRNPFENDYRLNRLTRAEAREAVAEPAARRGIAFEDGLVDAILDDLGKDEVAPPQAQLVCSTLYEALEARSGDRPQRSAVITRELYTSQDGAAGILRGHLGRVLSRDLPAEQRPIAQRLLEALITSDIRRVIRTRAELAAELAPQGMKPETLETIMSQLVDSRLLRVEEVDGGPAYELAHDYLLDEIKLDPAVQARKAAQELLEQEVRAYQRHGTLLSDDKLAIIEARRGELVLNDDATALIQKSERALKRRQRLVVGGIGLVIVLIIVGALSVLAAVGAQSVADQARMQQATSVAAAATASAREAGANKAAATAAAREAEANESAAIVGTREAIAKETLRRAFEKSGIVPVGDEPRALASEGVRVWVANWRDGTVQAINAATGDASAPIKVGDSPNALTFAEARLWVANTGDNTVQAIDAATLVVSTPITVGDGPIALSSLGGRLWVVNTDDGTVQAIDLVTGNVGTPIKVGNFPIALAYDGSRLWVANRVDNAVQAIDLATGDVGAPIKVGNLPIALAYDGSRLWVANMEDGTVQAINPETRGVGAPIAVGGSPRALVFDWRRGLLWVANADDDTVQTINPETREVGAPIAVGRVPYALVYDSRPWVANSGDNTIQAIGPILGR